MAVSSKFGPYYGVRGINSIYNPKVSKDQMSLSHLWIQNDGNAKISLGWQVSFNFIIVHIFQVNFI